VVEMRGIEISENEFYSANWFSKIYKLLSLQKINRPEQNGAYQAAEFINSLI